MSLSRPPRAGVGRPRARVLLLCATAAAVSHGCGARPSVQHAGHTVLQNDSLTVTHAHMVDRFHVTYVREGRVYGIEDHFVYLSEDSAKSFRMLGRLPKADSSFATRARDAIARLPPVRRVRRNSGPSTMVVLASGTVLVFYDHIYRLPPGDRVFTPILSLSGDIQGPFGQGVAVDAHDRVYFSEYATHYTRPARRVLRGSDDGQTWSVVYTFPPRTISHVHSIQYDPVRDGLWIATGDEGHENSLLFTDDDFASLDTVGGGSQDWRIVSLIVTDTALYWGSDNDRTAAGIFRWSFADRQLTRVAHIGNPSYYSTRLGDGTLVVTTAYEPLSVYSRRHAPERTADLWVSRDGSRWQRILQLPYRERRIGDYLVRARIQLPGGDHSAPVLLFSPFETTRWHFTTQRWKIRWHR